MGAGYPAVADRVAFHAWINDHSLPVRYYVAGYPPRSVTAIKHYLAQRAKVAELYAENPEPQASRLLSVLDDEDD